MDVHILVDPALSVSEGHQIGESVRSRLLESDDEVADVTVHIDPEDDELASPCTHLPLRDALGLAVITALRASHDGPIVAADLSRARET